MAGSGIWAVVLCAGDFGVRELAGDELLPPDMIAAHPSEASARAALERIEAMHLSTLELLRPQAEREQAFRDRLAQLAAADVMVGGSLLHHCNLVNRCTAALFQIAQPRHPG